MKKQKIAVVLTSGFAVFIIVTAVLSLRPIFKFESWVNSRLEKFAEMPYSEWESLHGTCKELAAQGEDVNLDRNDPGYQELPEIIKDLEPLFVWVNSGNVTLRFSGGHSQFVHIEYYGDRSPPELELITESIYSDVIFPRKDQRPIQEILKAPQK